MELELTQKQTQTLSPQMIQSIEILQMNAQELTEYVEAAVQENPVLELEEQYGQQDEVNDLRRKLEWLEANDFQNRGYHAQDSENNTDPLDYFGAADDQRETLYQHILAQLKAVDLPPDVLACAKHLAASLNGNGWLEEELSVLAWETGQPEETMQQALAVVQSLEPAGTAARNLAECLKLQLLRRQPVDELAVQIVERHLDALSKSRYGLISRALKVSEAEVRRACALIRGLNPHPCSEFTSSKKSEYIIPDIMIVQNHSGDLELLTNDSLHPALTISPFYRQMLRENDDSQVQDYLMGKLRHAQWIIRAVAQRKSTLTACAQCILELQEDFFRNKGALKAMSLADIAQRLGVHESTVSRALNGKYLQCPRGTYPISYFFSRALGGESKGGAASPDQAKALLRQLIEGEDKRKPLSDQKLCERMAAQGCVLSRRTVAKYRDELGIPGTTGRKQYEQP